MFLDVTGSVEVLHEGCNTYDIEGYSPGHSGAYKSFMIVGTQNMGGSSPPESLISRSC